MYRIIFPAIIAGSLAACSGTVSNTTTADAAECGIALALAGATGGSITAAIAATPACLRLPADVLAQIQGTATAQVTAARRTGRLR